MRKRQVAALVWGPFFLFQLLYCAYWIWRLSRRRGSFGFVGRKTTLIIITTTSMLIYICTRYIDSWYETQGWFNKSLEDSNHTRSALLIINVCTTAVSMTVSSVAVTLRFWRMYYSVNLAVANTDQQWISLITQPVGFFPTIVKPSVLPSSHLNQSNHLVNDPVSHTPHSSDDEQVTRVSTLDLPNTPEDTVVSLTSEIFNAQPLRFIKLTGSTSRSYSRFSSVRRSRLSMYSVHSSRNRKTQSSLSVRKIGFRSDSIPSPSGAGLSNNSNRPFRSPGNTPTEAGGGGERVTATTTTHHHNSQSGEVLMSDQSTNNRITITIAEEDRDEPGGFVDLAKRDDFTTSSGTVVTRISHASLAGVESAHIRSQDGSGFGMPSPRVATNGGSTHVVFADDGEEKEEKEQQQWRNENNEEEKDEEDEQPFVEENWFFAHRYDYGNPRWIHSRLSYVTPPLAVIIVVFNAWPTLWNFGRFFYFAIVFAAVLAIAYMFYKFPPYNDSLKVIKELELLKFIGICILALFLCAAFFVVARVLLGWILGHKRELDLNQNIGGNHWAFNFVLNCLFQMSASLLILAQTKWVCLTFPRLSTNTGRFYNKSKNQGLMVSSPNGKGRKPVSFSATSLVSDEVGPWRALFCVECVAQPLEDCISRAAERLRLAEEARERVMAEQLKTQSSSDGLTHPLSSGTDMNGQAAGTSSASSLSSPAMNQEKEVDLLALKVNSKSEEDLPHRKVKPGSAKARGISEPVPRGVRVSNKRSSSKGVGERFRSLVVSFGLQFARPISVDNRMVVPEDVQMGLKEILADERGFRSFMSHLFSEFSFESLLCVVELVQFSRLLEAKERKEKGETSEDNGQSSDKNGAGLQTVQSTMGDASTKQRSGLKPSGAELTISDEMKSAVTLERVRTPDSLHTIAEVVGSMSSKDSHDFNFPRKGSDESESGSDAERNGSNFQGLTLDSDNGALVKSGVQKKKQESLAGFTSIASMATDIVSQGPAMESIVFPSSISGVKSSIVFHSRLSVEQKFLVLFEKYINFAAEMCVNISFKSRMRLARIADYLSTGMLSHEIRQLSEVQVNSTVFDEVIRELLRLLRDSLSRFIRTEEYLVVRYHWYYSSLAGANPANQTEMD